MGIGVAPAGLIPDPPADGGHICVRGSRGAPPEAERPSGRS